MRTVSWPTQGDRPTFHRRLVTSVTVGAVAVVAGCAAAVAINPPLWQPVIPLGASAVLMLLLWAHGSAQRAARRAEIIRSFAGLSVVHHGMSFEIADEPIVGEFPTRKHASQAALDRGGWAVIVHAWDRYYVLRGQPSSNETRGSRPFAFRSRAVADVVPAIRDDVALGA